MDVSDDKFAEDIGINIPQHLLYTPQLNDYVLSTINKQTVDDLIQYEEYNPDTNKPYTREEAQEFADSYTKQAREEIYSLMDQSKK